MSSRIFEFDMAKWVRMLIPPDLRKPRMVAWLLALTAPLNILYQTFRKFREGNLYRLKITPQVVYLERALNDRYDIAQRRIRITDGLSFDPIFIFLQQEDRPVDLYLSDEDAPEFIYTAAETDVDPLDFEVIVPADIQFQPAEMRGVIDAYKLPGKKYSITQL